MKNSNLITSIKVSFKGTQLEDGISWQEADVLDSYESLEEREIARSKDEKQDWSRVSFDLIEDLKFQCVMPFLDAKGLKYYLPIIMLYGIQEYKNSSSLILDSLLYSLTRQSTVSELQKLLNQEQIKSVFNYLNFCLDIGEDYFDIHNLEEGINQYWVNS